MSVGRVSTIRSQRRWMVIVGGLVQVVVWSLFTIVNLSAWV